MGKERAQSRDEPNPIWGNQAEAWGVVRGDCHLIGRQILGGNIRAIMAPAQPAPPPGMGGHSEGYSQFLTRVVAAEWEGSTKLTIKAAKAAGSRCPWEPLAPSLDSTVTASVAILAAAPSPEGTAFKNTTRRSLS